MREKTVKRFYCDFCRKAGFKRKQIETHERHCYRNPKRVPYEGELTYSGQMGRVEDFGDFGGPEGSRWLEWVWHESMPAWWPGAAGMIYHEGAWYNVPGHTVTYPTGAHGYAGGPPPEDEWPTFQGIPVNEFPARVRWKYGTGPTIESLANSIANRLDPIPA